MISYQDRTFCSAKECSKFSTCGRALTDEVIEKANEWWGRLPGVPIARFTKPQKLECYDPRTEERK